MPTVPQIPLPAGDRWMQTRELAQLFGLNAETINRWRRTGRLKGYPVGKMFWYKRSDVNVLLEAMKLPTI